MSPQASVRREALERLGASPPGGLAAGMVDALFFTPRADRTELLAALERIAGRQVGDRYHSWVEWIGLREDLAPLPGYVDFKRELFARIDPRYERLFPTSVPHRIRLEEIVSGGVPLDGIPSLDDPPHRPASEAPFPDGEEVFGVWAGGESRAYPLRYLSWHELANDVLGRTPVVLAYCTLCRAGVAYEARGAGGERLLFGTSGLLYRSNKLMFDRATHSLWSQLAGEPVVGGLVASGIRLKMLPVTVTSWGAWRRRHPESTIVVLPERYGARWGYRYLPGEADRARRGVRFPAGGKDLRLAEGTEVYALRDGEFAVAVPVERAYREEVLHLRLGERTLVVVAERESGAIRAFECGDRRLRPGRIAGFLEDGEGRLWSIEEERLTLAEGTGEELPRVPGHTVLWFAWSAHFPGARLEP